VVLHSLPTDAVNVWFRVDHLDPRRTATGRLQSLQPSPICFTDTVSRLRLGTSLRGAEGAALVGHAKRTPALRSVVRVKFCALPEHRPRASTRPRWPVDAKPSLQTRECLPSTRRNVGAAGWAGAPIAGAPGATRVEVPGPPVTPIERGPTASARRKSKPRNPRNPRRPGRIPTHGKPESGAPAHPVAHATQTGAKRQPHVSGSLPRQRRGNVPDATK